MPRARKPAMQMTPAQLATVSSESAAQPAAEQPASPVSPVSSLPAGDTSLMHASVAISSPPRPLRQRLPEDVFAKYDAGMRQQAASLYRLLEKGPVGIQPSYPEVVVWMRAKGVRIKTRMTTEGSFYELESDVVVP